LSVPLSAPHLLADPHDLAAFQSEVASLNGGLKRHARASQVSGASRSFVVTEAQRARGYYAFACGGTSVGNTQGRFRRNVPDPMPIAPPGRLAVDRSWQGRGVRRARFRDGTIRVAHAADAVGIRGIVVHAISDAAKAFHPALGFESSPTEPMTLMVTLNDVRALISTYGTEVTLC
jgi:GNAT superfamily N-acetyltransferase